MLSHSRVESGKSKEVQLPKSRKYLTQQSTLNNSLQHTKSHSSK